MFEIGTDQAAGLRTTAPRRGPAMMPIASPAQPAGAYELLCLLAMQLKGMGYLPVILDATATEVGTRRDNDGSHLGLQHVLTDGSIAGLGHPGDGHEWLVMPAATGIKTLQQTALAAGGAVALSRLLSPFAPEAMLLLFGPAHALAPMVSNLSARVLVPVLPWSQASVDAYGAIKLLHMAGAIPVLAPLDHEHTPHAVHPVVTGVTDCARKHLGIDVERWGAPVWATGVQECALGRPVRPDTSQGLRDARYAGPGSPFVGAGSQLWS